MFRTMLVVALPFAIAAGVAFWQEITWLMGFGLAGFALFFFGSAVPLWEWRVARRLGPVTATLLDARRVPVGEKSGIDCEVVFERAQVERVRAKLRAWETRKARAGSSAMVDSGPSLFLEEIDLAPDEAGRVFAGRFEASPVTELPASERTDARRVQWQLTVDVTVGNKTSNLLFPLRAEHRSR